MNTITTTYRIQFNKEFNFSHFEKIIDYLEKLGIDTIYASPIFSAVPGSTHGYDGIDHHRINPEIGTLDQFRRIRKKLQKRKIKWLQDIVPNHMAFDPKNAWLMDVLRYGETSRYRNYFDSVYSAPYMGAKKLIVPFLGDSLDCSLASGEVQIVRSNDSLHLQYHHQYLPIRPLSYLRLLSTVLTDMGYETSYYAQQVNEIEVIGDDLRWGHLRSAIFKQLADRDYLNEVDKHIAQWNTNPSQLADLLEEQHYEMTFWQETDSNINYRRFFTVNGLICLNTHHKDVFEDSHRFIKQLLKEDLIDGLRVDHVDGLLDPTAYLQQLRELVGPEVFIVVEKILEQGEQLPAHWPIEGATGYEYLATSHNVATDVRGYKKLKHYYEHDVTFVTTIAEEQYQKKQAILLAHMQGDLENLIRLLAHLQLDKEINLQADTLKGILSRFLCSFPIYRLYDFCFPLPNASYNLLRDVFETMVSDDAYSNEELSAFTQIFTHAQVSQDSLFQEKVSAFLGRCMQFTGPLMAKGVEDTLMYTYNNSLAQNEVGNHPAHAGIHKSDFHRIMWERQHLWPSSLNATATHDTKRGEDSRSRLLVLTASSKQWLKQVHIWDDLLRTTYPSSLPHRNDRYAVYQALLGAYPMPGDDFDTEVFEERVAAYVIKYLREGKVNSNWATPDEEYESALQEFALFLLNKQGTFFPLFNSYLQSIIDFGILNSLSQLVLKFTSPGIPDLYQGTEYWDLSFVDPDNRRAVDYSERLKDLEEIQHMTSSGDFLSSLWEERHKGKIKLGLMQRLIAIRKQYDALSPAAEYIALHVKGKYRKHILAFARVLGEQTVITVVPLYMSGIRGLLTNNLTSFDWADTRIILPEQKAHSWENLLSSGEGTGTSIPIEALFRGIPLAVIGCRQISPKRSSGVLMSITSLPSKFGIGDLGKSSFLFAYQLHKAKQRHWQILPWNPTSEAQHYSPYSTLSAMAGNPLLISLDTLYRAGLLRKRELKSALVSDAQVVDYALVERIKMKLLNKAFRRVKLDNDKAFKKFCSQQAYWLDDYALFSVIRAQQQEPWYNWPIPLRSRNNKALLDFGKTYGSAIEKEKWIQYTFFCQWRDLQQYTQSLGVHLLGDVPFYPSLDSADVWANPTFFALHPDGKPRAIAGVPPDYFNADGQLWGMPVFNWSALKRKNYSWWIDRLLHYSKLFHQVRLDHFRAFSAYWEVPASDSNAKNGVWKPGPGLDFFDKLASKLPHMPFIAEDLGDIDDNVYALRDRYKMAGMKVLQFAFGSDMSYSTHIPHQYSPHNVAYTGTHDNNTLLGWYQDDLDVESRRRIDDYLGESVTEKEINSKMIKLVYSSVADIVIVPIQDILHLDAGHRMNFPASTSNNWVWRMKADAFNVKHQKKLKQLTIKYNR